MEKIIAEVTRANPAYTHIIFGKEEGWEEERAYFTRAGGYSAAIWGEFSGHYNMSILEATEDFAERLARGY